jgi:polyisoprenoid-binding protein YceI
MKKSTWKFAANSSTIGFKIKYYKISSISGAFTEFWGGVSAGADFTDAEVQLSLNAGSIDANNERRNRRLKSIECLHAREYPEVRFTASGGCRLSEGNIRELTGTLTIREISKEITLVTNYSRFKKGHDSLIMTFGLFGCVSRKDFKLYMEDTMLDDDIQITALLELVKDQD